MTKCKVGDRVKILRDQNSLCEPNKMYKTGKIHAVKGIDYDDPWFEGHYLTIGWPKITAINSRKLRKNNDQI